MTVKRGTIRGGQRMPKFTGEGPEDRETHPGGRIIAVNPDVAQRFMERMAAERQEAQRREVAKKAARLQAARQANKPAPVAEIKETKMENQENQLDSQIKAAHREYASSGGSQRQIAKALGIDPLELRLRARALDLPWRERGSLRWTPEAAARIAELYGLEVAADAPAKKATPAKKKMTRPSQPRPSANGSSPHPTPAPADADVRARTVAPVLAAGPATLVAQGDLVGIAEQLQALQALLSSANAQSVRLSGTLRLEMAAEVTF